MQIQLKTPNISNIKPSKTYHGLYDVVPFFLFKKNKFSVDNETIQILKCHRYKTQKYVSNIIPILQVPKTCENFMMLCKKGYYNDTIFHRLIRNFMVGRFYHLSQYLEY